MSTEQQDDFYVDSVALSVVLLASVLGALVLSACLLVIQLARERAQMAREARASRARRLRLNAALAESDRQPLLQIVFDASKEIRRSPSP